MKQFHNDIHINFPLENEQAYNILRNIQHDLEEILTKEFREKVPDFHFLQIVQNDGYYEEQKNPLIISYAIQNEQGETLRDPEDIVKHYFKQQGVDLVSMGEWDNTTRGCRAFSEENDGSFNEDLYNHLINEQVESYHKEGRTLFWETEDNKIKPVELKEIIENTTMGIEWVIGEYIKDNADMQVFLRGPCEATFQDLKEMNINWGEKYPHMRSINTLIENKASAEEMLHNVKGYKQ